MGHVGGPVAGPVFGIVKSVVVIARPFRFDDDDPRAMFKHLDAWASRSLRTPDEWNDVLRRCGQWLDYSARNQTLLASYGIATPVAGAVTWERVPSTDAGRGCVPAVGEHGLPVRVPVLDGAEIGSDRSRVGGRTASAAGSHRWEPVFALEQLARRPAIGTLAPAAVPAMREQDWTETVRKASGRLLGRTPRKIDDPAEQLVVLAGRVPLGPNRGRLGNELAEQAAWLVADRVGMAKGPLVQFDPRTLDARDRWRAVVDVRHAAALLIDGVSHALGVELSRSPLPRHEIVDDRVVAPGRRNYLAPSDVRALPLGVWIEAGPYTRAEWMARGVAGAVGVAAFLRVNERSYLAAYETKGGALWRLETTGRGAHQGLVGEGTADDLVSAKRAVREALAERFPDVAQAIEPGLGAPVVSPGAEWSVLPGGRDDRTEQRVFDEYVTAIVSPGPGGRWEAWISVAGEQRQGDLSATSAEAKELAESLARGALMERAVLNPEQADQLVHDLATSPRAWGRDAMVAVVGHRLSEADRAELALTTKPDRLVELMRDVGVLAPTTMLRVLRAEQVPLDTVVDLVPALGVAVPDAIRRIHLDWRVERPEIAVRLGATSDEMRAAGCSPTEILAVAPREELRRLDTREQTWMLVGPSLVEAGYSVAEAVGHLVAHAPTPETFAAGVSAIVDRPVEAFALAVTAPVDDLVSLSERYELSPAEAAATMAAAGVDAHTTRDVLTVRCDGDLDAAQEVVTAAGVDVPVAVGVGAPVVPLRSGLMLDNSTLREAIGKPDPAAASPIDDASLREALRAAVERPAGPELEISGGP